jgi:small-conductance mechanosensitive channel
MQEACESRAASFETPPFHFCIDFKRLFMVYFFAVTAAATVPLSRSYAPFSLSLSLSLIWSTVLIVALLLTFDRGLIIKRDTWRVVRLASLVTRES